MKITIRQKYILLTILCIISIKVNAQQTVKTKITGLIRDSATGLMLKAASLALFQSLDNRICASAFSIDDGKFYFNKISAGQYKLRISILGYMSKELPLVVSPPDTMLSVGIIEMLPNSKMIREVEVTARKNLLETQIDRFIYHADQDPTNLSGTAVDVFRKVPMLMVDPNGNISLFGSGGIKVLINGRPSSTVAFSVSDALKIIPAAEIKSIEVITSPSARYDAEGSAGIINIITKRRNLEGLYGSSNLSAGNLNQSATGSVNYRTGKLSVNGNLNCTRNKTILYATSERNNATSNLMTLLQRIDNKSQTNSVGGQFGAEYNLDSSSTVGITMRLSNSLMDYDNELLSQELDREVKIFGDSSRYTIGNLKSNGIDLITDYVKHFKRPQQELSASVQYSTSQRNTYYQLNKSAVGKDVSYQEINFNDGGNKELTFQLDYSQPFQKGRLLESGIKVIRRHMSSDFGTITDDLDNAITAIDSSRTGRFQYEQNVLAVYGNYAIPITKLYMLKFGARAEETIVSGIFSEKGSAFDNSYLNLIPTVSIGRKLKRPGSIVKLGYSRRIQRPSLTYLNPYISQVDDKNIRYGNPLLDPELTDAFELAYSTSFKKTVMGITGYFRNTHHIIESVTDVNEVGISFTTYQNISSSNTIGSNIYIVYYLTPKWSMTGSLNLYHYGIQSSRSYNSNGIVYSSSVSSSLSFGKGFAASILGLYNSSKVNLQGTTSAWGMMSTGITKEVMHKRGKIGIASNNPFLSDVKINKYMSGVGFNQYVKSGLQFRSLNFTFNYQFGKTKKGSKAKKLIIQNDDLKEEGGQLGANIK